MKRITILALAIIAAVPSSWRSLLSIGLLILITVQEAGAGSFEPKVVTFDSCSEHKQVHIRELKEHSRSSKLYFTKLSGSRRSTDEYLLRSVGAEAMVFSLPVFPDDAELPDDIEVDFNGTIHKRKASFFEVVLGGGRDRLFYRTRIGGTITMVDAGSFTRLPIDICTEALEG